MNVKKLSEIAVIATSNVDKKSKDGEQQVRLCNFVDVYHNWAITTDIAKGFMVATANSNQIKMFSIKKGQVAITKDSETRDDIGISTYIADDFDDVVLGYHNTLITPNSNELDGAYLNVVLNTNYAHKFFEVNSSGSGQRFSLTNDIIGSFPVPLPSLDIQKKISAFFSTIDRIISNNRSIVSELESLARLIYDYWFVQFDFPDDRGRPYKSSGGQTVWNDKLKRYIPAAWDVVKLGDICESMIAGDWGKSEPTGNYTKEVFCIRGADIPDVQCGSKGKMPTRYILPNNFETKRLTENNLVVEISGGSPIQSTGRIAIVTKQLLDLYDNRIICTNFCKAIKIKSECVYLIYFMWRSLYDNRQMFSFEIGTTGIKNLDIAYILENVYIAIPPQKLLNSFNHRIEKFLNCIFSNSHENEYLTSLRDFLLPMLMNGQVTVK